MSLTHKIIQTLLSAPKFSGRDYLIEKLPNWFIKPAKGKVVLSTIFGFKINLDPVFDKNIENVIYERGVYEQGTVSVLQDFLQVGDTFVDVGANIGWLSLVGAKKAGVNGKVYAFEPVPTTFNILKSNKELNQFSQIELNQFALGNKEEVLTIYPEKENRGGASILNHQSGNGVKIEVKKLDNFNINSKINVIKIDVEGFELDVLKGALEAIKKDKPKLIIEHSIDRNNTAEQFEIYNWLLDLGIYKIYKLKNGKERKSELIEIKSNQDLPDHDNIFCIVY
jgi:FkbM family methyltransferase